MAFLQKVWKPKATSRSRSVYWEEFARCGRSKFFFDKKISSSQITSAAVSGSVIAAGGHSPSHRSFGFSFFTKFFPSSRNPAADHKSSTICSIQNEALLYTETLSRIFATSAMHFPLLWGCNYSAVEVAATIRVSILTKLSEAGLLLLTGQRLGGAYSQNEKTIVPKQVLHVKISGLEHVGNDSRLCDKQTQMDTEGVVYIEGCKCKPHVLTSRNSCTLVSTGVRYGEGHEESEVEEYGVGSAIHAKLIVFENVTMQGCLDAREVSRFSIAHYSYDPVSLLLVVEDLYGSFAEKESPRLEFIGFHDPQYSNDPSMNLDTEGVQHRNLRLLSGACCLPHPNKVKTGGEDAYFICSEEQVLGVADGVGGWADVGVDAGDYARELMLQSKLAVAKEPHGYVDPARVMIRAHARTKCRGSSTACIIALSNHGLQAANLGDSGFVVMRNGRIIFKSPVQQHQFNIPFQLECGGSDPPNAAEVFSLQVAAGDVLVAGTDGLFDNLYDYELTGIVIHSTRAGLDPQVTAYNIAALARERAEDRDRQTPFSTAAQEAGFRFYGGKMDDITVIVSSVTTFKPSFLISLPKL